MKLLMDEIAKKIQTNYAFSNSIIHLSRIAKDVEDFWFNPSHEKSMVACFFFITIILMKNPWLLACFLLHLFSCTSNYDKIASTICRYNTRFAHCMHPVLATFGMLGSLKSAARS